MKKKFLILFCLLAAGFAAWHLWPEYRSGYSEEQRRLWNARRQIYPVVWLQNKGMMEPHLSSSSKSVAALIGKDVKTTEKLLERKAKNDERLLEQLEENRDQSGPDYQVKKPSTEDLSRLPLEGLTRLEVARRGLSGDGDACLEMIQSLCLGALGTVGLTWREKYEADKWLDRAIDLKRPGAVFLKNYLAEVWNLQLTWIRPDGGMNKMGDPIGRVMTGYGEFVNNLTKGDVRLYRTAVCIVESTSLEEDPMIYEPLRRQAEQGDIVAQKKLAKLYFEGGPERIDNYLQYLITSKLEKEKKAWENLLGWLPDSWKDGVVKGAFACGFIDADRSADLDQYRKMSRYALNAARGGDLESMYLWVRFGTARMERFSSEEWNDVLRYNRILFESGYIPYLRDMRQAHTPYSYHGTILCDQILRTYYSKGSYEKHWKKDYLLAREGTEYEEYVKIIKENDLGKIRKMVDNLYLTARTDYLLRALIKYDANDWFSECSKEVQSYLLEQMEKWAAEGDPYVMYALVEIYDKGISLSANPERMHALLERALSVMDKYPLMQANMKHEANAMDCKRVPLKQVIRLRMADMVLKYPEFRGRDEKKAYEEALKVKGGYYVNDYHYPVEVYRILGQFHERGVGMPVDKEKALEYYKKGAPTNKACKEGVKRLYPSDKSGEGSGNK